MAINGINNAGDPFELAKAKEAAHHYRWQASKANPKGYGDKLDLTHGGTVGVRSIGWDIVDPAEAPQAGSEGL